MSRHACAPGMQNIYSAKKKRKVSRAKDGDMRPSLSNPHPPPPRHYCLLMADLVHRCSRPKTAVFALSSPKQPMSMVEAGVAPTVLCGDTEIAVLMVAKISSCFAEKTCRLPKSGGGVFKAVFVRESQAAKSQFTTTTPPLFSYFTLVFYCRLHKHEHSICHKTFPLVRGSGGGRGGGSGDSTK